MKILNILVTVLFILTGCYGYQPTNNINRRSNNSSIRSLLNSANANRAIIVQPRQATTEVVAAHCPSGMVLVEGEFCPNVEERCLRWANDYATQQELRCLEFAPSRCLSQNRIHMRFCMDRYEYPNQEGVNPTTVISWYQSRNLCERQGRRLCTSREWTFACEGPNMNPYPYGDGLHRDRTACRIDVPIHFDRRRFANPATRMDETRRTFGAVPSGSMPRCVSWSGVHDMTGNSDEWVDNLRSRSLTRAPYRSGLMGGWHGPIRARCRPLTDVHGPGFVYPTIGTRCCSDID